MTLQGKARNTLPKKNQADESIVRKVRLQSCHLALYVIICLKGRFSSTSRKLQLSVVLFSGSPAKGYFIYKKNKPVINYRNILDM